MQKYGVLFCEIFTKNTIVFTNCRKIAWAIFYAKIHTATFLKVKLLKGLNHGICHQFFPNSYAFSIMDCRSSLKRHTPFRPPFTLQAKQLMQPL